MVRLFNGRHGLYGRHGRIMACIETVAGSPWLFQSRGRGCLNIDAGELQAGTALVSETPGATVAVREHLPYFAVNVAVLRFTALHMFVNIDVAVHGVMRLLRSGRSGACRGLPGMSVLQ